MPIIYKKEKGKISKTIKIITYQPRKTENPKIVDIKSTITEYPKISHNLPKTIRQVEKVSFNSSLYSDTKNVNIF